MAQGNIVQGMAHGALGDMVLSRLNGVQVSRVRNRTPRNPRTAKQLYQRAIMATVMRAYTAGAEIFDHAFERYTRGADCQHRFFARNCAQLRSLLAADLQSGLSAGAMKTFFGAPKVNSPTPSPYIISEGSLTQGVLQCSAGGSSEFGNFNSFGVDLPDTPAGSGVTYADLAYSFMSAGFFRADDIFTLCYFAVDTTSLPEFEVRDTTAACSKQFPGGFGFVRMAFNENVLSNNNQHPDDIVIIGDGTSGSNGGFFYVTGYSGFESASAATRVVGLKHSQSLSLNELLTPPGTSGLIFGGFMGVIHSRRDTQLRNNCTMIYSGARNNVFVPFGINSYYILKAWQQGTETVGLSDAILESDSFIRA